MATSPLPCAYCRKHPAVAAFIPFCSERCKMADLGQWLTGTYRVPGTPSDAIDSQDDESPDPESQENNS